MIVSVVTPTLNSERWMEACIGSVKSQAAPGLHVEHVVVDGGSTDRTVEIALDAGCTLAGDGADDGIFDAINRGTKESSGDLVGFLGADDLLLPGGLEAIARRYRQSGRRWVAGSYRWTDATVRSLGEIAAPPSWLRADVNAMLGWSYPLHMATYVERSLFDEIGGFDTNFPVAADYKFFCDAMLRAPFAREPQLVAIFRRHGDNTSMANKASDELARISHEYGPTGRLRRAYYRFGIKAWVNARNPRWMYRKLVSLPPVADLEPAADDLADRPRMTLT
jgi:glycosyltransferase involved in cell wall biosynthesis